MKNHFLSSNRLQKFESDSEDDDNTTAVQSPIIKDESDINQTLCKSSVPVASSNDIEIFSAEDVGNNVTICHDTDVNVNANYDNNTVFPVSTV